MSKKKGRRKQKLSNRLFLGIALIMLVCISAIVMVDTRFSPFIAIFQAGWDLMGAVDVIGPEYVENIGNSDRIKQQFAVLEKNNSYEIEVFDEGGVENGKLLYSTWLKDSYPPAAGYYDDSLKRVYELTYSGHLGDAYFERRNEIDPDTDVETEYIVYSAKMENGHWIRIYIERSPLDQSTEMAVKYVLFLSIFMFSAALFVALIFSRMFARPLTTIADTTHRLSKLDFSQKCPPSRVKEIATLSDSINEMSDALDVSLKDLQEKNQKLQDDIEKERTLEHLRTGFISNVSHELKTPIAIIQGYAEGLKLFIDSDVDMARSYCDIIMNETQGMHSMVMKLLEIIKYDTGDYKPQTDEILLQEMSDDWFLRNRQILEEKGVSYENNVPDGAVGSGDSMLIGSVLNNYLSNAVAHAAGEKIIRTWLEEIDDSYRLYVYNTGGHIEDKDIDKIWVSFYRADKAMSRAEGRFGLGLAIVESIQRLHDRKCGVANTEGGVTFWFDIKKV